MQIVLVYSLIIKRRKLKEVRNGMTDKQKDRLSILSCVATVLSAVFAILAYFRK